MSPLSTLRVLGAFGLALLLACVTRRNPVITEFMADNVSFIADEDGAFSDWIEMHNPGAAAVNLNNWALTDDAANPTKWKFPAVTMQPRETVIEQQFAPAFPPMAANESHGLQFTTTYFVSADATARYLTLTAGLHAFEVIM